VLQMMKSVLHILMIIAQNALVNMNSFLDYAEWKILIVFNIHQVDYAVNVKIITIIHHRKNVKLNK
jgi:hypothetical protein